MYSFLAKNIVLPLGDKLRGTHILRFTKELEEKQWWTPEQTQEHQNVKLQKLIKHSYENVPYWRKLLDGLKLRPKDIEATDDLQKLPILTKDIIRKSCEEMLAQNYPKGKFIVQHSSGSTGEPLRYYTDKDAYSWRLASMFRFWGWAGYEFGQRWVRISLWPHDKLSQKLYDRLGRCIYVHFYDINDARIGEYVRRIREKQPPIIRGYACATYLFARYLREHGIDDISPRAVITTGDMLFSHYRHLIEAQFGCKVYDTYGGEGISIAGQCERGRYHLDVNNTVVELLHDSDPVSTGELGDVIVTDLNNYAMPFIRYKIGDLATFSNQMCTCGRGLPLMQSIEGRDTDIIVTPDGKYVVVHFFTALFEFIEGVNQFQVIQQTKQEIKIRIVKNEKFTDEDIGHIRHFVREGAGDQLEVRFSFVDNIPVTRSGKRRFVISRIRHGQ